MGKNQRHRDDPNQTQAARALAVASGFDPDERVPKVGDAQGKTMPRWTLFMEQARQAENMRRAADAAVAAAAESPIAPQGEQYKNAPLKIFGQHDEGTITQMRNCMGVGNVVAGVICADGHLGYAQPVGGVIAYEGQVSISGVGFDIGCGNGCIRLDTKFSQIEGKLDVILHDITKVISFGVGRVNEEKVEHELFDDGDAWRASDMEEYRKKAMAQLGTVGSGNHFTNIHVDEKDNVWIGVHFGSRGLGHTSATRYLKAAGGTDGMHVPPAVVDINSEIGQRYLAAMNLAGQYAFAGREWVLERIRKIVGGTVIDTVHNHHNYGFLENHYGKNLYVVRKGATPAFPGQRGYVGGSMVDDAVIIEGVDSPESKEALYSTVHGAGRLVGRKQAKRQFTRERMEQLLRDKGVLLAGGGLDESGDCYRKLSDVIAAQGATIKVLHRLRPVAVAMAGDGVADPFRD